MEGVPYRPLGQREVELDRCPMSKSQGDEETLRGGGGGKTSISTSTIFLFFFVCAQSLQDSSFVLVSSGIKHCNSVIMSSKFVVLVLLTVGERVLGNFRIDGQVPSSSKKCIKK